MSGWQKEEHLQCQPAVVKLAVQNNIVGNGPGYYKIVFITETTSNLEKQRTYNLKRAGYPYHTWEKLIFKYVPQLLFCFNIH